MRVKKKKGGVKARSRPIRASMPAAGKTLSPAITPGDHPRERNTARRVPLTITLDVENLAFIESCVSLKEFNSVDKLFDAALAFYRKYVHALNTYAEDMVHKGYSRAEVLESVELETVVTKTL
jgi:hypothetical protein